MARPPRWLGSAGTESLREEFLRAKVAEGEWSVEQLALMTCTNCTEYASSKCDEGTPLCKACRQLYEFAKDQVREI